MDPNFVNRNQGFNLKLLGSQKEVFMGRHSLQRSLQDRLLRPPPPSTPTPDHMIDSLAAKRVAMMEQGENMPVPDRAEKRARDEEGEEGREKCCSG